MIKTIDLLIFQIYIYILCCFGSQQLENSQNFTVANPLIFCAQCNTLLPSNLI